MANGTQKRLKHRWKWWLVGIGLAVGLIVIMCNLLVEGFRREMEAAFADRPVIYTMPAAAQIIDEYTSLADWFGDFEYCATFRVSDTEYDRLLQYGFNWIYMGQGSTTPTPNVPKWLDGRLPEQDLVGACFDRLTTKPNKSAAYHYLFEAGNGWERLLAIDEKEKIIYYYRVST